ncbi:carboxypeptidase B-like [Daphnia carinata]|uniref:carboxypeptidase B-like n=1 Tax=Daphnia carinata TaxID=120202 RepID=UPI00257BF8B1|nr:carboxypeptidase B-like [Daphnia carinata]
MLTLLVLLVFSSVFAADPSAATEEVGIDEKALSYSGFQVWSITILSNGEREILRKITEQYNVEVWKEPKTDKAAATELLVAPQVQKELKVKLTQANISYVIKINDLQTTIDNGTAKHNTSSINTKAGHSMDWTSYHRLVDIYGYLSYLASTYPGRVELINIGTSYEKRPLYVVRIFNCSSSVVKPAIWIDGGIHAREWISPALATYIIRQLVEVPANEALLTNVDWYIMPVMNPDGYEYTHTSNRLWRKTRSVMSWTSCRGVDPNRNFGYKWGGLGTSTNPCSEVYKGTSAFTEPETLATSNFIKSKASSIKLYLTLHSYGQSALIPWGYDVVYPSDYSDMLTLAKAAVAKFSKYRYSVGNSAALYYPAAGGSDDWAKSIGIKYSYTFELSDTGAYGFLLPASNILPVCQDFFPALDVFAAKVATL